MSLFREEVLAHKIERLQGNINLSVPISWHIITGSIGTILGLAIVALAVSSYSRTEAASGTIIPAAGMLQITSGRPGRLENLYAREGQFVRKGQRLAWVSVEEVDRSGAGKDSALLSAIDRQSANIREQQIAEQVASASRQKALTSQIAGLNAEIESINSQISSERRLIDLAKDDLNQAKLVAARGFISKVDLARREETMLTRQQQLSVLVQSKSSKVSTVKQLKEVRAEAAANADSARASLNVNQAGIDKDRLSTQSSRGYSLISPATGRVVALNATIGNTISASDTLMAIVPDGGNLIAVLTIPSKSIAFVQKGQSVRLALDAFPFERFGTLTGTISSISQAPIRKADHSGLLQSVYLANVTISRPYVYAYGQKHFVSPGMTINAKIITKKQNLIEVLLDPIFAASSS